jgi:aldehyde:ferredoxin oxidoreductase
MSHGFTGTILRVDLTSGAIDEESRDGDFYRTYLGGSGIGTYFLLKETSAHTDPLSEQNVVTIAPGVVTGAAVSGVSRCCVTALSPETGAVGDTQAGGQFGPAMKRAGYDAIVVTGKADTPSYLLIDGGNVEIRDAAHLSGKTVLEVHDGLTSELTDPKLAILQCGPAGERLVRFACLVAGLNDAAGRGGLGAVFGSKNLRAVAVRGGGPVSFADPDGLKALARRVPGRLEEGGFVATLRRYGTAGVVSGQARVGNLVTRNYSRGFHEDHAGLDGANFEPAIGAGATTCFACAVRCRKKVRADGPDGVRDRLGGPEFETLGLLGSNLEIFDAVAVARANALCNDYGLDTIAMGALAAYLFECREKGLIRVEDPKAPPLRFGEAEGLLWLIERVARREGIGDVLAGGFARAIETFGEATAPMAIHVKGRALPAHMPQVKPSQGLMYAVCPIGADHMSSEHDWLVASEDEEARGLGLLGAAPIASTGPEKVRATVYSQYYYSMLDAMCLCMFCWGPGSLFSYRELEELLRCATGWECTLWELMKAGERRVNMMRHVNARRGFTRADDRLPTRLGEPLPDGASEGRCVDADAQARMQEHYYAFMGWDRETGNPTEEKLLELGLGWAI